MRRLYIMRMVSLLVAPSLALAKCECGYTVNATSSNAYALFTDLFETDFLHLYHVPNSSTSATSSHGGKKDIGWQVQEYNVSASDARGPWGKIAQLGNVVANPLSSIYDWGGTGSGATNGGEPGLQIWARKPGEGQGQGDLIGMGEIASERDDMLYGSFRIGVKMSGVNGTCGAFFWYRDDAAEIDLEFLSRQLPLPDKSNSSAPLNLVVQTPQSQALGYDAAPTADFKLYALPFLPSEGYHEYRIDWLPHTVDFYADGQYLKSMTDEIPSGPGRLLINHWSNGDPNWSGGPPETDAVMTISYVKAYFNSSNVTRTEEWTQACSAGWADRTCILTDQKTSIDPTGPDGNTTGRTTFFTLQGDAVNQTVYPGATAAPGTGGRVDPARASTFAIGVSIVVLVMGLAMFTF